MMSMKKITAVLLFAATPLQLQAQTDDLDMGALNSAIAAQRQISETQRQLLVTENLSLTDAESTNFWPVYREYRNEVSKLDDRAVSLLTQYAEQYLTLTDDEALALLKASMKLDSDREKLKQRYVSKFKKVLPGVKVARYVQIEIRLDTIARLKLQTAIPLAM
jgi:predicted unusual protein kinase regulating ubiquinone biosynthesis (AarF/ABC1/UbiB family)